MAITKKKFSFVEEGKTKYNSNEKYKADRFFFCGDAFARATGLPGPVMNSINMFLGHSNTAKTTALIKAAVDAQAKDILPVFIITEKKWSWAHAKQLGLECEQNEQGVWDGNFFYSDNFQYLEQISQYVVDILDSLEKKKPTDIKGILFLWDSVGSIPCKMTYDGKGGKMANASALSDMIGMTLNSRITEFRKEKYPYDVSMIIVNQPWVDVDMKSPMSQPEIKAKGGNALWLACSLIFLFGKQKKAGVSQIRATKNKRSINIAMRTKISVLKNHVNGIAFTDGKIIATPEGFIDDTPTALNEYKAAYSNTWIELFKNTFPDVEDDGKAIEVSVSADFDDDDED